MPDPTARFASPPTPAAPLRHAFARTALMGAAVALAVALALGAGFPGAMQRGLAAGLAMVGYLAGVWLAWVALRRGFGHPTLGLCNVVTFGRLAVTAGLLAALVVPPPFGAVFGLAGLALVLDGVDGWLARREGRVSAFGARFDMEVDSALALVLALTALSAGTAGAAVLLIALPRYVFVIAGKALPWLNAPLPERFSRKVVCVVQVGALVALQLPLLPPGGAGALVAGVAGALAWSFGRDVVWLWQARA